MFQNQLQRKEEKVAGFHLQFYLSPFLPGEEHGKPGLALPGWDCEQGHQNSASLLGSGFCVLQHYAVTRVVLEGCSLRWIREGKLQVTSVGAQGFTSSSILLLI